MFLGTTTLRQRSGLTEVSSFQMQAFFKASHIELFEMQALLLIPS